jgi:hypothetical protein
VLYTALCSLQESNCSVLNVLLPELSVETNWLRSYQRIDRARYRLVQHSHISFYFIVLLRKVLLAYSRT